MVQQSEQLSPWCALIALLTAGVVIIDISIVNVSLPSIMSSLSLTQAQIAWIGTGYLLANVSFLSLAAEMERMWGLRKIFLWSVFSFLAASLGCALSRGVLSIVLFRMVQGGASGFLMPVSMVMVKRSFPEDKLNQSMALFGSVIMLIPSVGPIAGGYLTETLGWRAIFGINLPIGAVIMIVAHLVLPFSSEEEDSSMDRLGSLLLFVGIGSLQYVLQQGQSLEWMESDRILFFALIALFALPWFIIRTWHSDNPVFNLRLLRDPIKVLSCVVIGIVGYLFFGLLFLLPLFAQRAWHLSPIENGWLYVPGSLAGAALSPIISLVMVRFGLGAVLTIGMGCVMYSLHWISHFSEYTPTGDVTTAFTWNRVGLSCFMIPLMSSGMRSKGTRDSMDMSGLLSLFRQLGGSVSYALLTTRQNSFFHNHLDGASLPSLSFPHSMEKIQEWAYVFSFRDVVRETEIYTLLLIVPIAAFFWFQFRPNSGGSKERTKERFKGRSKETEIEIGNSESCV